MLYQPLSNKLNICQKLKQPLGKSEFNVLRTKWNKQINWVKYFVTLFYIQVIQFSEIIEN